MGSGKWAGSSCSITAKPHRFHPCDRLWATCDDSSAVSFGPVCNASCFQTINASLVCFGRPRLASSKTHVVVLAVWLTRGGQEGKRPKRIDRVTLKPTAGSTRGRCWCRGAAHKACIPDQPMTSADSSSRFPEMVSDLGLWRRWEFRRWWCEAPLPAQGEGMGWNPACA